jgi:antirestriction protein
MFFVRRASYSYRGGTMSYQEPSLLIACNGCGNGEWISFSEIRRHGDPWDYLANDASQCRNPSCGEHLEASVAGVSGLPYTDTRADPVELVRLCDEYGEEIVSAAMRQRRTGNPDDITELCGEFVGEFSGFDAFAEEYIEALDCVTSIPSCLHGNIDYDAVGREALDDEGRFVYHEHEGTLFVFRDF